MLLFRNFSLGLSQLIPKEVSGDPIYMSAGRHPVYCDAGTKNQDSLPNFVGCSRVAAWFCAVFKGYRNSARAYLRHFPAPFII